MRHLGLLALLSMMLTGCNTLRPKHDNPVMQPPPRRVSMDDSRLQDAELQKTASTEVATVSASDVPAEDDSKVFNATVVARVNGAPIFAGEILERWLVYLQQAKTKLPPDEYKKLRTEIIQHELRGHIERRLLAERMRGSLKPDQIKQLEAYVDKAFDKEMVTKLKADLHVSTRTELELALNERGTTLDAMKDNFATQRLAMEYVASHIEKPKPVTRPDMVAYYQEHLDDYKIPAKVHWQEIRVSFGLGRTAAERKIQEAHEALVKGEKFAEVAKRLSDGPTASSGGMWEWTNRGSLADQKIEDALFSLPLKKPSDVIEGRSGFHILRVVDRKDETHKPFTEVQDEIEEKLTNERRQNLPQKFVEQLYNEAIIETPYDLSGKNAGG